MLLVLAVLMQSAEPGEPPTFPTNIHGGPQEMTCPIGGERFSAWQPTSYSTYGSRPDGRPYSYMPFPFPIPECPSNHMVMFDDSFSEAEKARLAELLGSDDYRKLIGTETSYYRGAWLAARLGRPDTLSLGLLLRAIWLVTPGSMSPPPTATSLEKLRRYQEEFVERSRRMTGPAKEKIWILSRAANALRQLGRFDEAERTRLDATALLAELDKPGGWDRYLEMLGRVIARRDTSPEPLDMIPPQEVPGACIDRTRPLSAFDQEACTKPEVKARIEEIEAQRAKNAH